MTDEALVIAFIIIMAVWVVVFAIYIIYETHRLNKWEREYHRLLLNVAREHEQLYRKR